MWMHVLFIIYVSFIQHQEWITRFIQAMSTAFQTRQCLEEFHRRQRNPNPFITGAQTSPHISSTYGRIFYTHSMYIKHRFSVERVVKTHRLDFQNLIKRNMNFPNSNAVGFWLYNRDQYDQWSASQAPHLPGEYNGGVNKWLVNWGYYSICESPKRKDELNINNHRKKGIWC